MSNKSSPCKWCTCPAVIKTCQKVTAAELVVISLKKTQSATQMLRHSSDGPWIGQQNNLHPLPPHLNPQPMVTCLNRRTTLYWASREGRTRFFLFVTDSVGKKSEMPLRKKVSRLILKPIAVFSFM